MRTLCGTILAAAAFGATAASDVEWGEAKWIGVPDANDPAIEKSFELPSAPASAVLNVTGVGYYEAQVNGCKVGKKVLDPTPTDYTKRVYYSTYDVTACLRKGRNGVRILLGNGLYNVQSDAAWNFNKAPGYRFRRTTRNRARAILTAMASVTSFSVPRTAFSITSGIRGNNEK